MNNYFFSITAAENNHLEQIATNDDPQDNVESIESSSNTYDANWDATVYANAYASSDSSSEESYDDFNNDCRGLAYGDILSQEYLEQLEAAENNDLEQIGTNDDPQDNVESIEESSDDSSDDFSNDCRGVAYGDVLEQTYLKQLEAAENDGLEPIATNDDPQDDVESNESSPNKSFDANWDATVYANAYASEDDSEGDSDSISDLSFSDDTSDSSDTSSNSSFSDDNSDNSDNSDSSSDGSDDDDSDPSSDESSISLEGEIALNVDQDAFCVVNPNSDEVSEDENTEEGNDDTFYSIIKYLEVRSLRFIQKSTLQYGPSMMS